jgi:hypothetical protein
VGGPPSKGVEVLANGIAVEKPIFTLDDLQPFPCLEEVEQCPSEGILTVSHQPIIAKRALS